MHELSIVSALAGLSGHVGEHHVGSVLECVSVGGLDLLRG